MANVGTSAVRIIDSDNDVVTVTNNRLDVNAVLGASASIDIGDVSLLLGGTAASVNNGAADATTLRVTIASDTTGVLSIDDNGGSLTIDGTVTAELSSIDNGVLDSINSNGINLLTAYKSEDAAHSSGDTGIHILAVRNDEIGTLCSHDGDYAPLQVSALGGLYVEQIVDGTLDTFPMLDIDNAAEVLSDTVGTFTDCREIFLQVDEDNSGYVMVGDGDVADNRGMKLNPGDTIILDTNDTRGVYLWGSAVNQNVRCMIKLRDT